MQKVTFIVQARPTLANVGVTLVNNVTVKSNGDAYVVLMGVVTTARGVDTYTASLLTGDGEIELGSEFTSRSQAGHAIQRAFQADERAAREAARAAKAEADAKAKAEAKVAREKLRAEKAAEREAARAAKAEARAAAKAEKARLKAEKVAADAAAAEAAKAAATVVAEVTEG
jgi:hypothetical protein